MNSLTLEQLQPYLAAGITLQTPAGQGTLVALSNWGVPRARVLLEGKKYNFHLADVLPVLRPFEQLIVRLDNGEVPIVEMARRSVYGGWQPGQPYLYHEFGVLWAQLPHATTCEFFNVPDHLLADGTLSDNAARYLRSRHFAVGLAAGQFIPSLT